MGLCHSTHLWPPAAAGGSVIDKGAALLWHTCGRCKTGQVQVDGLLIRSLVAACHMWCRHAVVAGWWLLMGVPITAALFSQCFAPWMCFGPADLLRVCCVLAWGRHGMRTHLATGVPSR
jgi:hypothetical protein